MPADQNASYQPSSSALVVAHQIQIDAASSLVCSRLNGSGIPCVLLKGRSIAVWLYDKPSDRSYSDTDLLLSAEDLPRAHAELTGSGYKLLTTERDGTQRPRNARTYRRDQDGHVVDLHTSLIGVGMPPQEAWKELYSRTQDMRLDQTDVKVLDLPTRLLHVALHAGQHGAESQFALRDLDRALSRLSLDEWRAAATVAEVLRADDLFSAGLGLRGEGEILRKRLGLSPPTSAEAILRASRHNEMALSFDWLRGIDGWAKRAQFVLRRILPNAAFMRSRYPWIERSPLLVVPAYVCRISWLLRHLVPGFLAWRKANKTAERNRLEGRH